MRIRPSCKQESTSFPARASGAWLVLGPLAQGAPGWHWPEYRGFAGTGLPVFLLAFVSAALLGGCVGDVARGRECAVARALYQVVESPACAGVAHL